MFLKYKVLEVLVGYAIGILAYGLFLYAMHRQNGKDKSSRNAK